MWRVHVLSHLEAAREVLPSMISRGDGYLVSTASSVALATQPERAAYSVTKHAALALAEWLGQGHRLRRLDRPGRCPLPRPPAAGSLTAPLPAGQVEAGTDDAVGVDPVVAVNIGDGP
jgi:short chain dehydrogenase